MQSHPNLDNSWSPTYSKKWWLYCNFITSSLTLNQYELFEIWPLSYQMTSLHINSDSLESIYGQEGWWVGNPCEWASGVKYQSCYLQGEPSTAVETPWCQRHARYSFASQIGLDTLRGAGWGGSWPALMTGDVHMRSSNNTGGPSANPHA